MDLLPKAIQVSGDVVFFHVKITFLDKEEEKQTWERMRENEYNMRNDFDFAAREAFGREFWIRTMTMGRGSIELIIVLAAAGSFYMGFSRYKNFIESLDLVRSQIQRILRGYAPQSDDVSASWILGPSLVSVPETSTPAAFQSYTSYQIQMILLIYFIASHAVILLVFLWLVVKKLA
jgi:hypothetical protein